MRTGSIWPESDFRVSEFDRSPGGHDDDGQRGVNALKLREEAETFLAGGGVAGVIEIDEEAIELTDLKGGDDGVGGEGGFDLVAFAF